MPFAGSARRRVGSAGTWSSGPALALLAFLQLTASVLNLLPVPGLDGGNMIQPVAAARRGSAAYNLLAPYGFILLFVLLWQSAVNRWFFTAVFWLADLLGLPPALYALGFDLIRFWSPDG